MTKEEVIARDEKMAAILGFEDLAKALRTSNYFDECMDVTDFITEDDIELAVEALKRQEAVVKWLEKEKSLYVLAEDDYYKGVRDGLKYAIDVVDKYQFYDDGTVKAGEHHE
jgi:hypothetical protein